jgi:hypothetical protein
VWRIFGGGRADRLRVRCLSCLLAYTARQQYRCNANSTEYSKVQFSPISFARTPESDLGAEAKLHTRLRQGCQLSDEPTCFVTVIFLLLVLSPFAFSPGLRQASMPRSCRHERVSTVFLMNGGISGLLKTFCNQGSNMHGPSLPPQANYARLYPNLKSGQSLGLVSTAHAIHLNKTAVFKDLDKKQLTYRADDFHERNLLTECILRFKLSTGSASTFLWVSK